MTNDDALHDYRSHVYHHNNDALYEQLRLLNKHRYGIKIRPYSKTGLVVQDYR